MGGADLPIRGQGRDDVGDVEEVVYAVGKDTGSVFG